MEAKAQLKRSSKDTAKVAITSCKQLLLVALGIFVSFGCVSGYRIANIVRQNIEMQIAIPSNIPLPWCNSSCLLRFSKDDEWIQDWNFSVEHGQCEEPCAILAGPNAILLVSSIAIPIHFVKQKVNVGNT